MNLQKGLVHERTVTQILAKYFTAGGFPVAKEERLPGGGRADLLVYLPHGRILLFEVKTGAKNDYLDMLTTFARIEGYKDQVKSAHPDSEVTEAVVTNMIVGENLADFFEKSGVHIIQIQNENDNFGIKLAPLLAA
ncbi:MAG: hypothetical protein OXE02_12940 [Chloroflexi bacterium]|nr:hypothetical protein [Chloroflexota bacterium]